MKQMEYIRTHAGRTGTSLLGLPADSRWARTTFLHAGRSSWPQTDPGPVAAVERGHSHPVYHAILYTGGRNEMIHDQRVLPCARGTFVLAGPGEIHEYRPQNPGGASFIEVTLDVRTETEICTPGWDELISAWLGRDFDEPAWPIAIPPPFLERLETLMENVLSALMGSRDTEAAAALAMGRLILELSDFVESGFRGEGGNSTDRLEEARLHLERGFASQLTTQKLADLSCLSEGAFIRSFSARYGMTPMAYRKKLRMTAAQHLMAVSGRPIGEIAVNVGYRDIHAFSRTFKAEIGMTASEWRRWSADES